jgi:hypothetical protein
MTLSPAAVAWMEEQTKIAEQVKLKERLLNGEFQTGLGKEHIAEIAKSGVLDEKIKRFGLREDNIGVVLGEALETFKQKKEMEELQAKANSIVNPTITVPPVLHQQTQSSGKVVDVELSLSDRYDPEKNKAYLESLPLPERMHTMLMQKKSSEMFTVTKF